LQAGTADDRQEGHTTLASAKAKKIQELREARGYSVEDVAHRMGETPERVRGLEASDEDPDEGVLSQYLDTLGMSQDEKRKVWDDEKHG
jgi:transcriptional regulator with XRE-family HTH domain